MTSDSLVTRWEVWVLVLVIIFIIVAIAIYCTKTNDDDTDTDTCTKSSRDAIASMDNIDETRVVLYKEPKEIINYEESIYEEKKKGFTSKGEEECKQALSRILGKPCMSQVRSLAILKNPSTGRNLELDVLCDNIAVEYHGKHHYHYVPHFHKQGISDFEYQVWKDNYKVDQCDKNGIYLITVPYTVPINRIEEYIRYYLPINGTRYSSAPKVVKDAFDKLNQDVENANRKALKNAEE